MTPLELTAILLVVLVISVAFVVYRLGVRYFDYQERLADNAHELRETSREARIEREKERARTEVDKERDDAGLPSLAEAEQKRNAKPTTVVEATDDEVIRERTSAYRNGKQPVLDSTTTDAVKTVTESEDGGRADVTVRDNRPPTLRVWFVNGIDIPVWVEAGGQPLSTEHMHTKRYDRAKAYTKWNAVEYRAAGRPIETLVAVHPDATEDGDVRRVINADAAEKRLSFREQAAAQGLNPDMSEWRRRAHRHNGNAGTAESDESDESESFDAVLEAETEVQ